MAERVLLVGHWEGIWRSMLKLKPDLEEESHVKSQGQFNTAETASHPKAQAQRLTVRYCNCAHTHTWWWRQWLFSLEPVEGGTALCRLLLSSHCNLFLRPCCTAFLHQVSATYFNNSIYVNAHQSEHPLLASGLVAAYWLALLPFCPSCGQASVLCIIAVEPAGDCHCT